MTASSSPLDGLRLARLGDWPGFLFVVAISAILGGVGASAPVLGLGAAVFLLITGLVAVSRPVGLAGVVFVAPFDGYVRSLVLVRDLLVTDLLILAFLLGHFKRSAQILLNPEARLACWLTVLFCAFHIVSLGPDNWADALDNVGRLIFFTALLWTLAASTIRSGTATAITVGLTMATLVRMGQEAIPYVQAFVLHPAFQFGGITSNPNTLGGFSAVVLPLTFALGMQHPSVGHRLFGWGMFAVILSGIVLTFSKSSWVAAAAGLATVVLHLLLRGWRPTKILWITVVSVLAAGAALPALRAVPAAMIERWTSYGSMLSNRERLRYVQVSGALIVRHPLAGVGLEQYGSAFKHETGDQRGPEDPHNGYLMVAAELGLPALGCYLLLAATVATTAWRRARRAEPATLCLRVGLSAAVSALLVFQFFSAEPLTNRLAWVIFGLALTTDARQLPPV